jgi:hypothetical protein
MSPEQESKLIPIQNFPCKLMTKKLTINLEPRPRGLPTIIEEHSTSPVGGNEELQKCYAEWLQRMSIFEVNIPDYRSAGGDPEVKRSILFKALI